MEKSPAWQALPPGFQPHAYDFEVTLPAPQAVVWQWLNTPETFTQGQLWPFRVEFVAPDPTSGPFGFAEGVQNAHHGPLMSFAGILTKMEPERYRDLQYYYGSYAVSFRLIRPTRLQFWLEPISGVQTHLRGRVDSYVRPWAAGTWTATQRVFWRSFRRWSFREVVQLHQRLTAAAVRTA